MIVSLAAMLIGFIFLVVVCLAPLIIGVYLIRKKRSRKKYLSYIGWILVLLSIILLLIISWRTVLIRFL